MRNVGSLEAEFAELKQLKVQLAELQPSPRLAPRPAPPPLMEVLAPDGSVRRHALPPRQQLHRDHGAEVLHIAPPPLPAPSKRIRAPVPGWGRLAARGSEAMSLAALAGFAVCFAATAFAPASMTPPSIVTATNAIEVRSAGASGLAPASKVFNQRLTVVTVAEPRGMLLDTSERPAMMHSAVITVGETPSPQPALTLDRALGMPGVVLPTATPAKPMQPPVIGPAAPSRANGPLAAVQPTRPASAKRGASVPMAAVGSSESLPAAHIARVEAGRGAAKPSAMVAPVARRAPPAITSDAGIPAARQRAAAKVESPIKPAQAATWTSNAAFRNH